MPTVSGAIGAAGVGALSARGAANRGAIAAAGSATVAFVGLVISDRPSVLIQNTDRTAYVSIDSLRLSIRLNERSTLSCELVDIAGAFRPVVGNKIYVVYKGVKRFGGYIESIEEWLIPGHATALRFSVQAVDFTRLLDWRMYSGSFENQHFYNIVTTIMDAKYTDADGISVSGVVNTGPMITQRIQDGLRPVMEWFRKLSTETGYFFRIDEDLVLQFGPLDTSNPAPFSVSYTSGNVRDLKIIRKMGDMRNVQYARTEYTTTPNLTATFTGDGATRDWFQFDGPFQGKPTMTQDGVAKTIGYWGFDQSGYDFYIDKEGWGLHRYPSQSAPSVGSVLVLTYAVRFKNLLMEEDTAAIAARAAIQGDSGRVEAIHEDRFIDSVAGLQARADGLLRQYGEVPTEITFETNTVIEPDILSLEVGQRLDVDLTNGPGDVNEDFLVTAIEQEWIAANSPAGEDLWVFRVRGTNIEPAGLRSTPIERLAEAVRIGPDPTTLLAESPQPGAGSVTDNWKATFVDTADPLVSSVYSSHYPADVDPDGGYQIQLTSWFAVLKTAPGAGGASFDIERSTNDGSSWTSIFSSAQSFGNGVKRLDGETFTISALNLDDRLRGKVSSADGTAAVLCVVLNGRKVAV